MQMIQGVCFKFQIRNYKVCKRKTKICSVILLNISLFTKVMNAQTRDVKISLTTYYLPVKQTIFNVFSFLSESIFSVVTRYFNIMHENFTKNIIIHIKLVTSKLLFQIFYLWWSELNLIPCIYYVLFPPTESSSRVNCYFRSRYGYCKCM